jgi:uncharacterized membrane protein YdbT with pleckstrin-like domain
MVPDGSGARRGSPGYGDSANNEPDNEQSEELGVLVLHPHWKTLLRPLVIAVVLVAAALVIEAVIPSGNAAAAERLVVAAIAILALLIWLMIPVLRWRLTTYELTTRRLRVREGILTRRGRDIPLARVNDVSFNRGLTDRIFGSGRLVVESAGEHGQIVLNNIPNVENVQSTLFQLVEDEQQRLGGEQRYGQP